MKVVDLSTYELSDEEDLNREYQLGEIVETEDDGPGIVAAYVEENFEFPVGEDADRIEEIEEEGDQPEMMESEASEDDPAYVIALQDGGSMVTTSEHLKSGALEGDDGVDIETWGDIEEEDAESAELAPVYSYCDNPNDLAELRAAKKKLLFEKNATVLADYVDEHDFTLEGLKNMPYEELQNIRGVDDPHIGFNRMPNGWTRKSVLQAWASLGAMWRTCYPRMIRVFGPFGAKRWCAALKDEVLRTENWRGKF